MDPFPAELFVIMSVNPVGTVDYHAFDGAELQNAIAGNEVVGLYRLEKTYVSSVTLDEMEEVPF